jgi:hypothetical protein
MWGKEDSCHKCELRYAEPLHKVKSLSIAQP